MIRPVVAAKRSDGGDDSDSTSGGSEAGLSGAVMRPQSHLGFPLPRNISLKRNGEKEVYFVEIS
jgi:hypothetical protein